MNVVISLLAIAASTGFFVWLFHAHWVEWKRLQDEEQRHLAAEARRRAEEESRVYFFLREAEDILSSTSEEWTRGSSDREKLALAVAAVRAGDRGAAFDAGRYHLLRLQGRYRRGL